MWYDRYHKSELIKRGCGRNTKDASPARLPAYGVQKNFDRKLELGKTE